MVILSRDADQYLRVWRWIKGDCPHYYSDRTPLQVTVVSHEGQFISEFYPVNEEQMRSVLGRLTIYDPRPEGFKCRVRDFSGSDYWLLIGPDCMRYGEGAVN